MESIILVLHCVFIGLRCLIQLLWISFPLKAGLSQCQVDDRNLRLAFERLDAEHKGMY